MTLLRAGCNETGRMSAYSLSHTLPARNLVGGDAESLLDGGDLLANGHSRPFIHCRTRAALLAIAISTGHPTLP